MSALAIAPERDARLRADAVRPLRVALFGTGGVARELAAALDRQPVGPAPLRLAQLSNARITLASDAWDWRTAVRSLGSARTPAGARSDPAPALMTDVDVVIDATASDAVAAAHAGWLADGIAVVTANKRGLGESDRRARAILAAAGTTCYGDSATVGAGLGAIARLRALHARGEAVEQIAGVLSGTLSWLLERHDGRQRFSSLVREACALGLSEPDPREDVGGGDVVRKLRILARSAGWPVADDAVEIDPRLACGRGTDPWQDIEALDAAFAELLQQAPDEDSRLAVVGRATRDRLRVGLEWLPPRDPLAQRIGCDNVIVIHSQRYRERPLVLRGPGAGAGLTAEALVDDLHGIGSTAHAMR